MESSAASLPSRKVYGCFDRQPYKPLTKVQDGWVNGKPLYRWIEFRMEPTCQYRHTDLGKQDERCEGCKWKQ